jgi:hypothetical protein
MVSHQLSPGACQFSIAPTSSFKGIIEVLSFSIMSGNKRRISGGQAFLSLADTDSDDDEEDALALEIWEV